MSCLTIAAREMLDLILMDVNLPGIIGLEATTCLKASPDLAAIPVVAMTAQTNINRSEYIATRL